jgi:hypothetical protein
MLSVAFFIVKLIVIKLSVVMLSATNKLSAECHYAKCHYAKCHYVECRYAECCYAKCRGSCRFCIALVPNPKVDTTTSELVYFLKSELLISARLNHPLAETTLPANKLAPFARQQNNHILIKTGQLSPSIFSEPLA